MIKPRPPEGRDPSHAESVPASITNGGYTTACKPQHHHPTVAERHHPHQLDHNGNPIRSEPGRGR